MHQSPTLSRRRLIVCWILGPVYAAFGVVHLLATQAFLPIMPPWVPAPVLVIQLTGLAEIAGGLGLLVPRLRPWAGLGLAAYAIGVYPANLHHAFGGVDVPGQSGGLWYHIPRLALQPVLVWLALWAGGWRLGKQAAARP